MVARSRPSLSCAVMAAGTPSTSMTATHWVSSRQDSRLGVTEVVVVAGEVVAAGAAVGVGRASVAGTVVVVGGTGVADVVDTEGSAGTNIDADSGDGLVDGLCSCSRETSAGIACLVEPILAKVSAASLSALGT